MKTRFFLLLAFTVVLGSSAFAQFNEYKYIVVPKKFDAFRKENMHQTSTNIKYLLTQKGFNAVYDDAMPEDLFQNRCLGLIVSLQDDSSFFATKVSILFKDCRSVEIFRTVEGRSKLKEFRPAYSQAIQRAFVSLDGIDYQYQPKEEKKESSKEETLTLNFKNDVKTLKEEPKEMVVEQKATPEEQVYKAIKPAQPTIEKGAEELSKTSAPETLVLEQESTTENQTYKAVTPKPALLNLLYAQPTSNGFQLVDSSPKIQYKLVETSVKDFYLVSEGDKSGVVFQKDGKWRLEYVENGVKMVEELNIKF
ncbi:MAG: hypothetical protein AAGC43_15935 [Bacteroidota bacterium]